VKDIIGKQLLMQGGRRSFMNEKRDGHQIPDTGGENKSDNYASKTSDRLTADEGAVDLSNEQNQYQLTETQTHAFEETFEYLEEYISPAELEPLQLSVTQIMVEAARGENANEELLWKRLDDLRRTHPHVLQKVLDSLNATGTGFHTRVRRISERMAEEINNPSPDQEAF
jgi:hypothetical protein